MKPPVNKIRTVIIFVCATLLIISLAITFSASAEPPCLNCSPKPQKAPTTIMWETDGLNVDGTPLVNFGHYEVFVFDIRNEATQTVNISAEDQKKLPVLLTTGRPYNAGVRVCNTDDLCSEWSIQYNYWPPIVTVSPLQPAPVIQL